MKLTKVLSMVAIASLGLTTVSMAEEIKLTEEQMKDANQVYFDRCAGCHGMLRKGALGPTLEAKEMKTRGTEYLKTIIHEGTPGGMPDWGKSGELTAAQTELMAKYIQVEAQTPPEKSIADMKKSHKV